MISFLNNLKRKEGQSLIEIIVALSIGTILIGAATTVVILLLRSGTLNERHQQSVLIAQNTIERIRSFTDSEWSNLNSLERGSSNHYHLAATSSEFDAAKGKKGVISGDNTRGLVGYWGLDESEGGISYDNSANQNHGTISGTTATSSCWVGDCLSFNGSSDNIDLGDPSELKITGSQTISLWLKPNSFSSRRNPYAKAYGGEGTITQETNGTVNYYYGTCGGNCSPYQGFRMTDNLSLNKWVHLAIVRDLDDMKLRWYKNGVLTNEANANYSSATVSTLNAYIGRGYVSNYSGEIDDVRIYNRALSEEEVYNIYNSNTFRSYFYVEDVCRTNNQDYIVSGVTPCGAGSVQDPNTLKVTTAVEWDTLSGELDELRLVDYVTRWRNNTYRQSDWSGTSGFEGPVTNPTDRYSTSSNINFSSGQISVSVQAEPTQSPGTPTYSNIAATSLTVNWTSASDADYYKLERAPDSSGSPGTFSEIATTTNLSYGDSSLTTDTTYWYRVRATNTSGDGPYSTSSSVTTGTWYNVAWDYRFKITSDNTQVSNGNTNLYYDLSNAPAGFWTNVKSDGGDIRVTQSDGTTEVAREVAEFDSGSNEGSLFLDSTGLSTSADTEWYVYYGNSSANDYASSDTYGSENVWDANYVLVSHDSGETDSTSNGNNGTLSGIKGESGLTSGNDGTSWGTVNLTNNYTNPVVFAMVNTENDTGSPKLAQIRNVGSDSFEFRMCEHENTDGGCDTHANENIGYAVFELSELDALTGVEAGTVTLSGGDTGSASTVTFGENLSASAIIIATQQTQNETGEGIVHAVNVGATSADLYLCDHNESSIDGCESHASETVAWMAFDPNNLPFDFESEGGTTSMGGSSWTAQSFSTSFSTAPVVLGMIQTNSGAQQAKPSMARSITTTGMDIRYCEHDSGDTCDSHNTETVGWLALEPVNMTGPTLTAGKIGDAYNFDGNIDWIDLPAFTDSSAATISAWFNVDINSSNAGIVSKSDWASGTVHFKADNGTLRTDVNGGGNLSTAYSLDTWYYAGYGYTQNSASGLELFFNGSSVGTASTPDTAWQGDTVKVASEFTGRYLDGLVDEVRISNSVRSDAWTETEYNNQNNPGSFWTTGSQESR